VPAIQAKLTTSNDQPPSLASGATRSSASPDLRLRPWEEISASPDPWTQPQPRPQEKSPPRLTLGSDRPRHRGNIITLLLASSGYKEQDRRPVEPTPATSNDGAPRATMTPVVLSPLRQQGNVSRVLAALPAVLLQGLGASPTTTLSSIQGSSSPPTATLACTQGLGTPLPDTIAHCYTPHCTSGPSPCIYKRKVQGLLAGGGGGRGRRTGGFAQKGRRADEPALYLSLPPSRDACNPYYERHPRCEIIRSPFVVLPLAPTHLGWDTQRR
jgi:hypothetical protein